MSFPNPFDYPHFRIEYWAESKDPAIFHYKANFPNGFGISILGPNPNRFAGIHADRDSYEVAFLYDDQVMPDNDLHSSIHGFCPVPLCNEFIRRVQNFKPR